MSRVAPARLAAEAIGTALLVGIGTGAIVVAARAGGVPQPWIALAWFVAVAVPVFAFVRISGAHLNPAVTLALAASRRIDPREAPWYIGAQVVGALAASGLVRALLGDAANLGATIPAPGQAALAMVGEAAFTALLIASVFWLADRGEGRARHRLWGPPLVVGISTEVIGPLSGSSLNPARSLAPAIWSGVATDLYLYLLVVPLAALAIAAVWRPISVDRLDRGPGRRAPS